jgi:hypothetical protein
VASEQGGFQNTTETRGEQWRRIGTGGMLSLNFILQDLSRVLYVLKNRAPNMKYIVLMQMIFHGKIAYLPCPPQHPRDSLNERKKNKGRITYLVVPLSVLLHIGF